MSPNWARAQSLINARPSSSLDPQRPKPSFPSLRLLDPQKTLKSGGGGLVDMAEVEVAAPVEATTPEVTAATEGAGATEAKGPHKLHRQWTFWYDIQSKPKPGAAWGTSLKKAYTFDTVEEFWSLYDQVFRPSKLQGTADFHLFKAGVEPKWEDPECANGGKWTVPCSRKPTLETMWLETLMALIGEQFDETEDICGIVASVRPRGDKLALWTRTASNEAVQVNIGKKWKDVIDYNDKITYTFHDDSRREKPSRGGRYTV